MNVGNEKRLQQFNKRTQKFKKLILNFMELQFIIISVIIT